MTEKTVKQLSDKLGVSRQTILYRIKALELEVEKNRRGAYVLNAEQVQTIIDNFNGTDKDQTTDKQKTDKKQTTDKNKPKDQPKIETASDMVQISKAELEMLNSTINDLKEDKRFLQDQLKDMTLLSDSLKTLTDQQQQLNLRQLGISENHKELETESDTKQSLWDRIKGK